MTDDNRKQVEVAERSEPAALSIQECLDFAKSYNPDVNYTDVFVSLQREKA